MLDRVATDEARVIGGAAGDDDHPAQVRRPLRGEVDLGQVDGVGVRQPVDDRLGDGVGLLVDLLEHEGRVAAALGGVLVPGDLVELAGERRPGCVGDLDAVRA